jgi:predicted RNase H-like nuclease (RuvC/YqgF family)
LKWLRSQRLAKLGADLEGHDRALRSGDAMLLNEFLKNHRTDQDQARKLQGQEATITQLKASVMQQQKQIEALTAGLQKVGARVEAANSVPRVVSDNKQNLGNLPSGCGGSEEFRIVF